MFCGLTRTFRGHGIPQNNGGYFPADRAGWHPIRLRAAGPQRRGGAVKKYLLGGERDPEIPDQLARLVQLPRGALAPLSTRLPRAGLRPAARRGRHASTPRGVFPHRACKRSRNVRNTPSISRVAEPVDCREHVLGSRGTGRVPAFTNRDGDAPRRAGGDRRECLGDSQAIHRMPQVAGASPGRRTPPAVGPPIWRHASHQLPHRVGADRIVGRTVEQAGDLIAGQAQCLGSAALAIPVLARRHRGATPGGPPGQ